MSCSSSDRMLYVIEFSAATGQIVKYHEHLDTDVAWRMKDAHGVA